MSSAGHVFDMISRMKQNSSMRTSKRRSDLKESAKFRLDKSTGSASAKKYSTHHLNETKKIFKKRLRKQKIRSILIWIIISVVVLAGLITFSIWINQSHI